MRTTWTQEKFDSELTKICKGLGRFPSNQELCKSGRGDIANQITKREGFIACSKRLGFERRLSDSDTGWNGEEKVLKILSEYKFDCEARKTMRCPYDILVSGVVRVDVKTASYAEYGGKHKCTGWFYRLGKDVQSDIVILYRADLNDCFVIPWNRCPSTNITISKTGTTYTPYHNNFGLLFRIVAHRKLEQETIHP